MRFKLKINYEGTDHREASERARASIAKSGEDAKAQIEPDVGMGFSLRSCSLLFCLVPIRGVFLREQTYFIVLQSLHSFSSTCFYQTVVKCTYWSSSLIVRHAFQVLFDKSEDSASP